MGIDDLVKQKTISVRNKRAMDQFWAHITTMPYESMPMNVQ
ncbi:MAG: hypothetical protein ABIC95_02835 [archaeon]